MRVYYLIHPNGREKLRSTTRADAIQEFKDHWTAQASWLRGKTPRVRRLVETVTEEIMSEECTHVC